MKDILQAVEAYVTAIMPRHDASHDLWHVRRVVGLAGKLQEAEGGDREIILLAAWLHDLADPKLHDGNEESARQAIIDFLAGEGYPTVKIERVMDIIDHMSFRHSLENRARRPSLEEQIVSDADKLDAMGAIGIARTFHFGGRKNNPVYDPSVALHEPPDAKKYKRYNRPTIHHFYDKLLRLKDMLYTPTARRWGRQRHKMMEAFLRQFFDEWQQSLGDAPERT
jgi:uncharacterized protein